MIKKIDFICLGASKSGTTAIANFLNKCESVYCPEKKEVNYFNQFIPQDYKTLNPNFNKSFNWYNSHFQLKKDQTCINGELTPCYLSSKEAAKKIKEYNPDIKLFVVLRDPIYRAHSQYLYALQNGVETNKNFYTVLKSNPGKYIQESMYFENLSHYYKVFKGSQIKVFIYEDFFKNINSSMNDLFEFIGAENYQELIYDSKVINKGKVSVVPLINIIIGKLNVFMKSPKNERLRRFFKKCGIIKIAKAIKNMNLKNRKETDNILSFIEYQKVQNIFKKDTELLRTQLKLNIDSWGFRDD